MIAPLKKTACALLLALLAVGCAAASDAPADPCELTPPEQLPDPPDDCAQMINTPACMTLPGCTEIRLYAGEGRLFCCDAAHKVEL